MILLILLMTGIAVGLISSFFGVGGGIVTIPVLYALFPSIDPAMAIATSLGLILLNSLMNLYRFLKLGLKPRRDIFLSLGLGISLGALVGIQISLLLQPSHLKMIFGGLLIIVALKVALQKSPIKNTAALAAPERKSLIIGIFLSFLGGVVAGITGLGGGIIIVPLLMIVFKVPYNQIPLYSNLAMGVGTLTGVIRFSLATGVRTQLSLFKDLPFPHYLGGVSWLLVLILFIGGIPATKWGSKLSQKASPKLVKGLYVALLIIFSMKIFLSL